MVEYVGSWQKRVAVVENGYKRMTFQSCMLLLLYDFNRFIPASNGQPLLFWSNLQRFPYMGGVFFFCGLGASLRTILFLSHLSRVIYPDNLSPHQRTFLLLSDFVKHAVGPC